MTAPHTSLALFPLGWLQYSAQVLTEGTSKVLQPPASDGLGGITEVALAGATEIAVLREHRGVVQIVKPQVGSWSVDRTISVGRADCKYTSICVYDDWIYLLNKTSGSLQRTRRSKKAPSRSKQKNVASQTVNKQSDGAENIKEFLLGDNVVTERTIVRAGFLMDVERPAVVIGPTEDGSLLAIDVSPTDACGEIRQLPIGTAVARDYRFCVDDKMGTVVISDTQNGRIVELILNTDTGSATIEELCSGMPQARQVGRQGAQSPPRSGWRPGDIFVFRLQMKSPETLLESSSLQALIADHKKEKPRTLLFCDLDQPCVRQYIDMTALSRNILNLNSEQAAHVLLGKGQKGVRRVLPLTADSASNLTRHAMPAPAQVIAMRPGDLLIRFDESASLLVLTPAVAMPSRESLFLAQHRFGTVDKVNS